MCVYVYNSQTHSLTVLHLLNILNENSFYSLGYMNTNKVCNVLPIKLNKTYWTQTT